MKRASDLYESKHEAILKWRKNDKKKVVKRTRVALLCVETGEIFHTIKEAADSLGIHSTTMKHYMDKNKGCVKGFTFKFIN